MKKKIIATLGISAMALTMFAGGADAGPVETATTKGKVKFLEEGVIDPTTDTKMVRPGTNVPIFRDNDTGMGSVATEGGARLTMVPHLDFGQIKLGDTAYAVSAFNNRYFEADLSDPLDPKAGTQLKNIPNFIQVLDTGAAKPFTVKVSASDFVTTDSKKISNPSIRIYKGLVYNNSDTTVSNVTQQIEDFKGNAGAGGNEYFEIGGTAEDIMKSSASYKGASVSSMVFSEDYKPLVADTNYDTTIPDPKTDYSNYMKHNRNADVKLVLPNTTGLEADKDYVSTITWTLTKAK